MACRPIIGGMNILTEVSSMEGAKRLIISAYSGFMGRRLASLGLGRPLGSPLNVLRKMLSGPNSSKKVTTPLRNPVSRLETVTTVVIPITIPRIVSMERKRFVQTEVSANRTFSVTEILILTATPPPDSALQHGLRGTSLIGYPPPKRPQSPKLHRQQKHPI